MCRGNELKEKWSFFKCPTGYPSSNRCQKCESCDKCQEVNPCLEFLMFGTGPVTHTATFDKHNDFECSKLITNGTDIPEEEFESDGLVKDSCHMVTDQGIEINFRIAKDTIYKVDSITCPDTSEEHLHEMCQSRTTCSECETTPGCSWCSAPDTEIRQRCGSKMETERTCRKSNLQQKYEEGYLTLPAMMKKDNLLRLRPQKFELKMNVGDIKYLDFDYWLWDKDVKMQHSFPDNVDVKIFSTCYDRHPLQDVSSKGCPYVSLHSKVDLIARVELKSCSENAGDWKGQQEIRFLEDGAFYGHYIGIDFTTFCSCSCDNAFNEDTCRNDKKSFQEVNPCVEKRSCTECLRDQSCNWCTSPSYTNIAGAPLARCNSDNSFTSTICPENRRLNPSQPLGDGETCTSCDCASGVCHDNKEDIITGNLCVSQLTCGECTQVVGCAWCPDLDVEGAPHCNLESNWVVTLPVMHYTITDNSSFMEWVVPTLKEHQYGCKKELYKDRSMVPKEMREFYPNNGKQFREGNFNYDYSMPLLMNTGRKYDFQLSWSLSNLNQAKRYLNKGEYWKDDPEFQNLKVTISKKTYSWTPDHMSALITRGSGPYHQSYYENSWDEEDWKPSVPPFDYTIIRHADQIICNISLELSKCPEKPHGDQVWVYLEKVGGQLGKDFPLGVFSLSIETVCDCKCQEPCADDFEYRASSCNGGNMGCGVCQDCPEEFYGEFCQCSSGIKTLKSLPVIEIGKKDDLVGTIEKFSDQKFSFDHGFIPLRVSPETLQCNATYCQNQLVQECSEEAEDRTDFAKMYRMTAIYGDHRLLPGAELEFKLSECYLRETRGGYQYATRFGFGSPVSGDREYPSFGQSAYINLLEYWSDEVYVWSSKRLKDFFYKKGSYWYERELWKNAHGKKILATWKETEKRGDANTFPLDPRSSVKLTVTEIGAVWSWGNFSFTHTIDMSAKTYYPIFFLHGCEDKDQFSSVKIINSKVGGK